MTLNLDPNLADPDDFYRELIDSQREMDDEQAALMKTFYELKKQSIQINTQGLGRIITR